MLGIGDIIKSKADNSITYIVIGETKNAFILSQLKSNAQLFIDKRIIRKEEK